jgi:tetratricopeptide (TPR) repeat protein
VEEEAGDFNTALQHYTTALQVANEMRSSQEARAFAQSHLGHLYMRMGDPEQAIANLEQSLGYAQKVGEPVNALYDALNLSSAYIVAGRHADARTLALESLEMAEAMRHAFLVAGLSAGAAEACLGLDALDEAESLAMRSLSQEEEVHRPYALTTLGLVALKRAQSSNSQRYLREAISSAQQSQDRYAEAHTWLALADAHRASHQPADERAALESGLTLFTQLGLTKEADRTRQRLST